jgi:hypothetical protein
MFMTALRHDLRRSLLAFRHAPERFDAIASTGGRIDGHRRALDHPCRLSSEEKTPVLGGIRAIESTARRAAGCPNRIVAIDRAWLGSSPRKEGGGSAKETAPENHQGEGEGRVLAARGGNG